MATAHRGYKYFQNGYLADGEDPTVYASYGSEEDPESNFGQQVQEANAAAQGGFISPPDGRVMVPGMVGVSQDMVPPPAPPPPNGTGLYFDTDDPGAPGQSNIPIYGAQPPAPHDIGIGSQYSSDLAKEREAVLGAPVRKPPKWWERVAAGALGGAAGWSNAASRTRNPIDIPSVTQAILYPGYQGKLAEWQSRVLPLQEAAKLSGQQAAVGWKSQQVQSEMGLKRAQAEAAVAHAKYWQDLGQARTIPVTDQMAEITGLKPGTLIPQGTATELMRILAGKYVKPESTFKVTDADMAKRLGVTPGTDVPISVYRAGITAATTHNPAPITVAELGTRAAGGMTGNPQIDAMTPQAAKKAIDEAKDRNPLTDALALEMSDRRKRVEADNINTWKINEEQRIKTQHQSALGALEGRAANNSVIDVPRETARINEEARAALQNVENEYARRGRGLGGTMDEFDVKVNTGGGFDYTKRGGPAPPTPTAPVQRPAVPAGPGRSAPPAPGRGAPPPAQQAANRRPAVGDPVLVDGTKKAVIVGFNPTTGKPILRAQ